MESRKINYLDRDFNPEHSAGYTLLIRASQSEFSYVVTDGSRLLACYSNINLHEFTEPSEQHRLLKADFAQRIIGLAGSGFTLVPAGLFNPDKTADFARFLNVRATDKVFSQPLDAANQVLFKVDAGLADKFNTNDVVFDAKGWIKAISNSNPLDQNIYLNIENDQVELLNFKDGKLRFYNRFEFKNEDELAYFTTVIVTELQLPAVTLILSGDIDADDPNSHRLAEFFGRVEINNLAPIKLPEEIEAHSVLSLTALILCGSSEAH